MDNKDKEEGPEAVATIFDLARNRSLDEQIAHPGSEKPRLPKRFYKKAEAGKRDEGHVILLDGRMVKTPAKRILAVPARALADAIAGEWEAQRPEINPRAMWLTRLANTAIDLVEPRRAEVIAEIVNFAGTDLLCYRADHPRALAARQATLWDPLLGWAAGQGIRLRPTTGILHVTQEESSLAAYQKVVEVLDPFRIAGLHNAVTLTGSAIIGLAVALGQLTPEEAFDIAHVDENWQMELSGEDDEERARLDRRRSDLLETARFIRLLG